MDTLQAIHRLTSRIYEIDPQNATKIIGYILTHDDLPEHNIIRIACGPNNLLHFVINQAKSVLQISSNPSHATSSSSSFLHQTPPRLLYPNKGVNVFNPCYHFARGFCSKGSSCSFVHANYNRFGRFQPDLHDPAALRLGIMSSNSRLIYIAFQPESTITKEDISTYFSTFGPVEVVDIPEQRKRVFGFVRFVSAETVELVFARGNPHFICGARVIVKPYKDKRTIAMEKHQQQIERGDRSAFESAEPFDHMRYGARMYDRNTMLRGNQEGHNEYQQTVDFQEGHRSIEHLPDSLSSSPDRNAGATANIS